MAKVCLNSCGLAVDANGNLGVNTAEAWPYTGTASGSGTKVFCDSTSGALYGQPEKFHLHQFTLANQGSGAATQVNTFGAPTGGAAAAITNPHTLTVTNPSPTLPMTLSVKAGLLRGSIDVYGSGKSEVYLYPTLSASGAITFSSAITGGRYAGATGQTSTDKFTLDDQWAVSAPAFYTLGAGGTVTFTIQGYIQVIFYNGNTTLSFGNFILDVEGWN